MSGIGKAWLAEWGASTTVQAAPARRDLPVVGKPKRTIPRVAGDPPELSIMGLLDRWLATVDKQVVFSVPMIAPRPDHVDELPMVRLWGPRSDGVIHASDLAADKPCVRRLAYGLYQAPRQIERIDPTLQRIFDVGHMTHWRLEHQIIAAVEAAGGQAWNEAGAKPNENMMSGTADVIIVLNGWPYIVEIKTMGKSKYDGLGAYARDDHRRQLNNYMGLGGVRAGIILYECKDNQQHKEYLLRFDEALWREGQDAAAEAVRHVRAGTLPPKVTEDDGCDGEERCPYYTGSGCKRRGVTPWVPSGPVDLSTRS